MLQVFPSLFSRFLAHSVPFSETTEVRLHTVSLYSSLELLIEAAKALQEQCKMFESFTNGQRFPGTGRSMVEQSCGQLIGTIHLQTALYCSKLLQVHAAAVNVVLNLLAYMYFSLPALILI